MHRAEKIFQISQGDVVSFVGAGGKTALLAAIAQELAENYTVAVTTTTRMFPLDNARFANVFSNDSNIEDAAERAISSGKIAAVFSGLDASGKCLPLQENEIEKLSAAFDVVLVEADGARGKSIKLPRPGEPVVPEMSNKALWVTGLDVLGKKCEGDAVFNPKAFHNAGFPSEAVFDVPLLRRALFAGESYMERLAGKTVYLCLHKADLVSDAVKRNAHTLFHDSIEGIVLTSVEHGKLLVELVDNSNIDVQGVLLCAGTSTRFGSPKMLSGYKGKPLVLWAVEAAVASTLAKVHVVINDDMPELKRVVASVKNPKIRIIENSDYMEGMSASVKTGVRNIGKSALMLLLGDMPNVDTALIDSVVHAFKTSAAGICAPFVGSRHGHPAVFHPRLVNEIERIYGDIGCREIVRGNMGFVKKIRLDSDISQKDVDMKEDVHDNTIL